jgi:hypothetical protein
MNQRTSRAALLVMLVALSTQTIAAARPDFGGFAEWSSPVNLGPPLNTAAEESAPALSDDQLSLYFNRNPNLPGDNDEDLYVSRRGDRRAAWSEPIALATINTPSSHERNATLARRAAVVLLERSPRRLRRAGPLRLAARRPRRR